MRSTPVTATGPDGDQALNRLVRLLYLMARDDRGATAIEYALIASMLGLALIPVLSNTQSGMASLYTNVNKYFVDIVK